MNGDKAFLDTNVFVYLYSKTEPSKSLRISSVIGNYQRVVSTQVLNEFCNVCIRKMKFPVLFVKKAVEEICEMSELFEVNDLTIIKALDLHEKYRFAYYDSLMIASALEHDCSYLLTEDMADGQVIEGRLTIRNIFADENF
jgi:predicted nucleic acid-binding protein